jgi:uncharacterized protein YcbK (DUF882 family)
MALGFVKPYDVSIYDIEQFVEIWPEISEIGQEICEGLTAKMDNSTVITPGSSNQLLGYIKGCLFMLGFSEIDKGSDPEMYDQYTSSAVMKCRSVMSSMGIQNDSMDSIDLKFVNGMKAIFDITEEEDVKRLWKSLKENRAAMKIADPGAQSVPRKDDSSGVKPAKTDPESSSPINMPTSSMIGATQIKPGVNFPTDDRLAKKSIVYSLSKDGQKQLSPNFKVADFRSKDGSDVILINPALIELLEKIRKHFGRQITITSGYRTPAYNAKCPGAVKNSHHTYGNAADIKIQGLSPNEIHEWIKDWHQGGLGLYKNFVHVDVRNTLGQDIARWYGSGSKKQIA